VSNNRLDRLFAVSDSRIEGEQNAQAEDQVGRQKALQSDWQR
jgi:hypothetical protein